MTYRQGDPGDECDRCDQLALPVTAPERCRACGATGRDACEYEFGPHGIERPRFRPKGCLAGGQLAPDQPLPYA